MDTERSSRSRRFRMPRAFTHPAWWCALALLLLNDHVWKGAGVLPAALTGKLSDFAGMLVAPPLVAWLLGADRVRARRLAALLVGAGLASIKLVPAAATLLEQALAVIGVPSEIRLDASDLWALALLPLGHALSRPMQPQALSPAPRAWVQRAGIALAALACVATTGKDKKAGAGTDGPQVENASGAPLVVVLASTEAAGGCSLYRDDRVSLLTAHAFIAPRELALDEDERADLTDGAGEESCGAASIRLPDGDGVLVFWRDLDDIESFAPADDDRRAARRVVVSGASGDYEIQIGDDLAAFELGETPPEPNCPEPEIAHSLEWSALSEAQNFFEVGEVRRVDDACLEVDWFALTGDTSPDTQRLCIPDWAFPFEAGEQLSVLQEIDPRGARRLQVTRQAGDAEGDAIDTQLVIWNDASEFAQSRVRALQPVECVGTLADCGAYVRAVEFEVRGREAALEPGEDATVEGSGSLHTRVLAGPARDVAWSAIDCQGAEAILGSTASVLELRTY